MLTWSKKYLVGIDKIDEQHRTFIEYTNKLERLVRITNPTVEQARFILQLIDFLEAYVVEHFEQEEECMHRLACPAHELNKKEHQEFLTFFRDFKQHWIEKGYSTEVLAELHRRTSDWIRRHILTVDRQLRQTAGESGKA